MTWDVDAKGYYRSDDTYVQPHYRSTPDGNPDNNYSYPDNIDPDTGNPDTYLNRYYFKEFDRDNDLKDSYQRQIDSLQQQIKLLEIKLKEKQFNSPTTTSRYTPSTRNKGYDEFEKEKDFMNREFFTVTNVIWGVLIVIVIVLSNWWETGVVSLNCSRKFVGIEKGKSTFDLCGSRKIGILGWKNKER